MNFRLQMSAVTIVAPAADLARSGCIIVNPAKIGLDHPRILAHFRRRSFGNLYTEIDHYNAVDQTHHKIHVVFDKEDGKSFRSKLLQQASQSLLFSETQTRGRLVKQEQLWICRQAHARFRATAVDRAPDPRRQRCAIVDPNTPELRLRLEQQPFLLRPVEPSRGSEKTRVAT